VYVIPGGSGLVLGYAARAIGPSFRRSGRWIWLLPSLVCAVAFLASLFLDAEELPYFFVPKGGASEEGIQLILVTLPAVSCCFYALGIRGAGVGGEGQ